MHNNDTIYALATPEGKSAIAVYRISGKNCQKIIKKISKIQKIIPNKAILTNIYISKKNKKIIDRGIIIYYKSPKTYTGENMLEISIHGSLATINSLNKTLNSTRLCRIAEPGEFTKRAFENNKIDLVQAESIIDLINAETELQREQAVGHLSGSFGKKIKNIEDNVKKILANHEAIIDFSEEEIPKNLKKKNIEQTKNIIKEVENILDDNSYGERIRKGFDISIVGKPNSGKSSLINYLAKRELAIVSKTPGTTRDIIELNYDIGGFPVVFYDTAGIRKPKNNIEKIGIRKAIERSKKSSINIVIIEKKEEMAKYRQKIENIIFVQSKIDIRRKLIVDKNIINISSKTGKGTKKLLRKIKKSLNFYAKMSPATYVSRERHRKILSDFLKNMKKSIKTTQDDISAEEIRNSLINLSKLTGKYDIEEILGIIFRDFCIGK